MSEWQPIDGALKDGTRVLCGWPDGSYGFLVWKTNHRIVSSHAEGKAMNLAAEYFGDPVEYDDYDLADPANFPTLYLPIPPISPGTGQ